MAHLGKALTMQRGLGLTQRAESMFMPRIVHTRHEVPKLPPLVSAVAAGASSVMHLLGV